MLNKISNKTTYVFIYLVFATILLFGSYQAVAAPVAAGTTITNIAVVTYTNVAGATNTVKSNIVTITVNSVNKVAVVGQNSPVVLAGDKALAYYIVTNNGNTLDSYLLSASMAPLAGANPAGLSILNIFAVPSGVVGGASGAVVVATPILPPASWAVYAIEVAAIPAVVADSSYNIVLSATSTNTAPGNNGNPISAGIGLLVSTTGNDIATTANYTLKLVKTIQNITQNGPVVTAPATVTIGKGDVIEYTDTIENASNGVYPVPVENVTIQAAVMSFDSASTSASLVSLTSSASISYNPPPASVPVNNTSVEVTGIPGPITLAQPAPDNVVSAVIFGNGNPLFSNMIVVYVNASASALVPGRLNVGDKVKIRYRVIAY